jgi:hypothetical protein
VNSMSRHFVWTSLLLSSYIVYLLEASSAHQIVVMAQMMLVEWLSVQNVQQCNRETLSRNDNASGTVVHGMICNVDASFIRR